MKCLSSKGAKMIKTSHRGGGVGFSLNLVKMSVAYDTLFEYKITELENE